MSEEAKHQQPQHPQPEIFTDALLDNPLPCKSIDCGGTENDHSSDCVAMQELVGKQLSEEAKQAAAKVAEVFVGEPTVLGKGLESRLVEVIQQAIDAATAKLEEQIATLRELREFDAMEIAKLREEVQFWETENESRAIWIRKMCKLIGYDNSDGFHSKPDPFEIVAKLLSPAGPGQQQKKQQ